MDLIKKFKVVIAVVLPILILILIKSFGANHFKNDAKKWAESSVLRSNLITIEQIGKLSGDKLIINLGKESVGNNRNTMKTLNIPAEAILSKKNLTIIRKHEGPILLFSYETAVSVRIWMVLSQMGYENIFILTNDSDNEVFKNKFRPDTITRPDL